MTTEQALKFCNFLVGWGGTHEGVIPAIRMALGHAYDFQYCQACDQYSIEKHTCVVKQPGKIKEFFNGPLKRG